MKTVSCLLSLLFIFTGLAFPETISLSLNEAITRAFERLPSAHSVKTGTEEAREKRKSIQTAKLPNLTGEASYMRIMPAPEIEFGGKSIPMAPNNEYDAHFTFTWELLNFGRHAAEERSADAFVRLADDKVTALAENLSYQVALLWFGVLYSDSSLMVEDSLIAALKAHREFIQRKVESGSAVDYDLPKTDVRISTAKSQRVTLQNDRNRKWIYLKNVLDITEAESLVMKTDMHNFETAQTKEALLVGKAFAERIEMKLALDAENVAKMNATLAGCTNRPSLGLYCAAGVKDGYPEVSGSEISLEDPTLNAVIGIKVSAPLWDFGRLNSRKTQAEFAVRVAHDSVEAVKRRIAQEVAIAHEDCAASLEQILLADEILVSAGMSAEAARVRYESGTATNMEYLDAQADRTQALFAKYGCRFKHLLNSIALKQAIGETLKE